MSKMSFTTPVSLLTWITDTSEVFSSIKLKRWLTSTLPSLFRFANLTSIPRCLSSVTAEWTAECSPSVVTTLPRLAPQNIA